ncbi:MAG TPA: glycosyltransferase family 2 protein [Vicinamibacterales bacterium]|jgi:glycosyltransferase involved in cell wall biosynthesis|nr:glycosyltransferase family 2 protein [Vicinamibacterales bacterium]
MAHPDSVSIVIPAYEEGAVIDEVVSALAVAHWREILVVDDGSADQTGARAKAAGARVIRHPYNKGNGAAVKTGIRQAAGEYIIILDADGQHSANDAVRIAELLGEYDLVVGARDPSTHATLIRRLGNAGLNWLSSYLTGRDIPDLTSGLRGARREHLCEFLHLLPNGFSTPTTTTLSFLRAGYNVAFVPIAAATRVGSSKIRMTRDGIKFFLILVRVMTIFSPMRIFLPISAASFALGAGYAVWTIATQRHVTNSSVLLILFSVVVFLVALVSEQISALRAEGRS